MWISQSAARELGSSEAQDEFAGWLAERFFVPYTINAFPLGDFHQSVVKHQVYKPTWAEAARLDYTCDVATIHDRILPAGMDGTISTLPLGWPAHREQHLPGKASAGFFRACADQLMKLCEHLDGIAQRSGRVIRVCLEPEPGCVLDRWQDVVAFFDQYLGTGDGATGERVRRHLGVCHDVCHSAVMFEPQAEAIGEYRSNQIAVGKVQVSAAVEVNFDSLDADGRHAAMQELRQFAEPKYLHQTSVRLDDQLTFYEDLPLAVEAVGSGAPRGTWRVHFHVPIHASQLGHAIRSTQRQIVECMNWFASESLVRPHFEVETYAWNVLPQPLRPARLPDGIAQELNWLKRVEFAD